MLLLFCELPRVLHVLKNICSLPLVGFLKRIYHYCKYFIFFPGALTKWKGVERLFALLGPPSSAVSLPFFGREGSPTKIDYRKIKIKELVPTYSHLSHLEDLGVLYGSSLGGSGFAAQAPALDASRARVAHLLSQARNS